MCVNVFTLGSLCVLCTNFLSCGLWTSGKLAFWWEIMFPWTYQLHLLWLIGGQSEVRPLFISSLMCIVRESPCVLRYYASILNYPQFLPVHWASLIFRGSMLSGEMTVSFGFNFTSLGKVEERRKYLRVQVCSSLFKQHFIAADVRRLF